MIEDTHPLYDKMLQRYKRNRDAYEGQDAIKDGGRIYLPDPDDRKDLERYNALKERALWLGITEWTVDALAGAVFRNPTKVELPLDIQYAQTDIDGKGTSLEQFVKDCLNEMLIVDRIGILVDFNADVSQMSLEEFYMSGARSYLTLYVAEDIDHWSVVDNQLMMVKLREHRYETNENFETDKKRYYRVLRIDEQGFYTNTLYDEHEEIVEPTIMPLDADGIPFTYIPFFVAGSKNNLFEPDKPPISAIADINITHYQVMADKLKNLHIHSGGTLVISSSFSTEEWEQNNKGGIRVGADRGIFVGEAGRAELLQLEAASATQTEIDSLEAQAVAIGAKLMTDNGGVEQTRKQVIYQHGAQHSVLTNVVNNLQEALTMAIRQMMMFYRVDDFSEQIVLDINKEFYDETADPSEIMAFATLAEKKFIAINDLLDRLRRTGWVNDNRTDEMIAEDIATQRELPSDVQPDTTLPGSASTTDPGEAGANN